MNYTIVILFSTDKAALDFLPKQIYRGSISNNKLLLKLQWKFYFVLT